MVFGWRMFIDRERLEDDHPEKRGSRGVINVQNTGLKPVLAAAKASSMHGVLCHPTRIPSREHCVQPALSQSRTGINECCEDWRSESVFGYICAECGEQVDFTDGRHRIHDPPSR
ncbi:hypothetical protein F444_12186 [Phytophthora nicotianae P1976]|uniref:Uncharacterized protein n=1 Tax=Phytophthora nicotianae P1976 TaxID=1317066 RepID=A0A080ZXY9_PHYNI|nr:hypothetical protein F444_12186 [Phytophthora nicotianae P1976]